MILTSAGFVEIFGGTKHHSGVNLRGRDHIVRWGVIEIEGPDFLFQKFTLEHS